MKNEILFKGYILSISVLLLFSIVIGLARSAESMKQEMKSSYQNSVQVSKLGYFIDDISGDIQNLVSVNYKMNNASSDTYNVSISDNITINKMAFLANYSSFLQGYGNVTGANISFSYSDPLTINFSNGMRYISPFNRYYVLFRNSSNSSQASRYDIAVYSNRSYSNYNEWGWAPSGTFVSVYYSDPTRSFTTSGYINPAFLNTFIIRYSGGQEVRIYAGTIDGIRNSIEVNQTSLVYLTFVSINATMPSALPASYNMGLNISYLNTNYSASVPA